MREFARFRNSENNEGAPWAACSDSSCGVAVYWRGCHSRRKRVKVRRPCIILHKTSGYTKNSIQRGTCPTIHRLAVATTRTVIRLKSSTLPETSTPNVEKTGGTFSFRRKRWNAIGIIRMGETTCAHRRPIPCTRRIPYTASHWEVPHDAPRAPLRVECHGSPRGMSGDSGSKNMLRRFRQPALTQETVTLAVTILVFSQSVFMTGIQADARAN
ncbi:hypothetical protein V1289_002909 [Bradyrhizobium sp. AZCC 2289]